MKIKTREIEITPEEFVQLSPDLIWELLLADEEVVQVSEEIASGATQAVAEGEQEVPDRDLSESHVDAETLHRLTQRIMNRRAVPNGQKDLYKSLYHADGDEVAKSILAKKMDRSEGQLVGVLGALGNRISHTVEQMGLDLSDRGNGIGVLLHVTNKGGEWYYGLRDEFREFLTEQDYEWLSGDE